MSGSKPKEFWIHNFPVNDVTPWDEPVAFKRYTNTHDFPGILPEKHRIHVIEHSAYLTAVEALKGIAKDSLFAKTRAKETLKALGIEV